MGLVGWSWFFLFGYILMMVVFGFIGQRKADLPMILRRLVGPMAPFSRLCFRRHHGQWCYFVGFPELAITQDYL